MDLLSSSSNTVTLQHLATLEQKIIFCPRAHDFVKYVNVQLKAILVIACNVFLVLFWNAIFVLKVSCFCNCRFAYIEFTTKESLSKALALNGSDYAGQSLVVDEASEPGGGGGRGRGGFGGGRGGDRGGGRFGGRGGGRGNDRGR